MPGFISYAPGTDTQIKSPAQNGGVSTIKEIPMKILDQLTTLFGNMFTRDTFAARLLERSFKQPLGWVELGVAAAVAVSAYWLAERIEREGRLNKIRWRPIRHIAVRELLPLVTLILGILSLSAWNLLGWQAVWLRLVVLAAYWMMVIRLVLAILHQALPRREISDFLERAVAAVWWLVFLLWLSGIDDIVIKWMKSLKFAVGSSKLNLYTVLAGMFWVGAAMILTLWLARWINGWLMSSNWLDINLRIVLAKVVKSALMILSVLVALPLVGIDLTVLSVFGGALGVGLGFGLQKIASNYVSGFIILADRSIRLNDRLTVGDFTGYVTEITSRYVVLSAGGRDALIPNETFVTSTVINESYNERSLRQCLDVRVAYQTDVEAALNILKEAAAAEKRVAASPAPDAFLSRFGDNGIELQLAFWVKDPENGLQALYSSIQLAICRHFKEQNIEFPLPQREIRVLSDRPEAKGLSGLFRRS